MGRSGGGTHSSFMHTRSHDDVADTLRAFFATRANGALIVLDPTDRIAFANDAAVSLLGADVLALLDGPDSGVASRAGFSQAVRTNGEATVDVRSMPPGAAVPMQIRFDGTRVEQSVVITARDVAPEMAAEREIRHLRRIESAGLLTASIVHDMNNLLTPILCLSSLVSESVPTNSQASTYSHEIELAAQRAAGLIRQLLAFVRRQGPQSERFNPADAAREMGSIVRQMAGDNIAVQFSVDDDTVGSVSADREQFEQVLLNLVANAVDAMPRGGRLTVRASNTTFVATHGTQRSQRPRSGVSISVSDTGNGIAPEVRDRIFERFFTTKGPQHGTGLGLATAHRFVVSHGGHVEVDSEPGHGTTVTIILPRDESEPPPQQAEVTHLEAPRGTETILVVDDDPQLRRTARLVLEARGHRVLEAETGAEALAQAIDHRVDLVLVDVGLQRVNGRTLVDAIRATGRDAKVLFMSGHPDHVLAAYGVDAERSPLIRKAFTEQDLLTRVRAVLDGEEREAETG